jgi:hypothetical protein
MDFLKKHYEKLILGVVLVGLIAAAGFIPFKVASEKTELDEKRDSLIPKSVKPLTNLDLTLPQASLKRSTDPAVLNFSTPHRLFNATPWQKGASGNLIKYDDSNIGPEQWSLIRLPPCI